MARKFGADVKVPFALIVFLVLAGLWIDNYFVGWAVGIGVYLLGTYLMAKVPLRTSFLVLMFCAFTLENPTEMPAAGHYKTFFYQLGALLLNHLNTTTGVSALSFSGMDLALATLFLIALYRRTTKSPIDRTGRVPTPEPLLRLAGLSLAGTAYVLVSGMLRGGELSFAVWQVDRVMYLPIVFLLCHLALRGPKDHVAMGRVLIVAAVIRACLAIYISLTVFVPPDDTGSTSLQYQTSHHDSMTFAAAVVLLVALVIQRASRSAIRLAVLFLPILCWAMVVNNRRMVWVQIAIVFLTLYFSTPMNAAKRKVRKILLVLSPVIAIYVAAGWSSKATIFKPVATMRSVVEPATDASSMTREIENYDIIYTIRQYPILGTGYGNGYWQMIPLPEMGYALERYIPHNSLLGLWAFCGYFGYTAMTLFWSAGVYFGLRAYHTGRTPAERTAALMSFGMVLIYMVQCWGDMGLGSWIGVFLTAPAIAVAGKLAVATGAWPSKQGTVRVSSAPARATEAPEPNAAAGANFGGARP